MSTASSTITIRHSAVGNNFAPPVVVSGITVRTKLATAVYFSANFPARKTKNPPVVIFIIHGAGFFSTSWIKEVVRMSSNVFGWERRVSVSLHWVTFRFFRKKKKKKQAETLNSQLSPEVCFGLSYTEFHHFSCGCHLRSSTRNDLSVRRSRLARFFFFLFCDLTFPSLNQRTTRRLNTL